MINKKNLIAMGLMAITPLFAACSDDAASGADGGGDCTGHEICLPDADTNAPVSRTKTMIFTDPFGDEATGSSATLTRDPTMGALGMVMATDIQLVGMPAGDLVTGWWVFFNKPSECAGGDPTGAGNLCGPSDLGGPAEGSFGYMAPDSAGVATVGADGTSPMGDAATPVVDSTGSDAEWLLGNGPTNLMGAEMHVVYELHGKPLTDPAELDVQTHTFLGGCNVGEPYADVDPSPCKDFEFAFFNPEN